MKGLIGLLLASLSVACSEEPPTATAETGFSQSALTPPVALPDWQHPFENLAAGQRPPETTIDGPTPFCGGGFSIALNAGETMTVRDPMLDFVVFHLGSNSADVSIYMGHHPDVRSEGTLVDIYPPMTFERRQEEDGSWSYLVNPVPDSEGPYFLHFFGGSFTGTGSDREIFDRFLFDDRDHIFCAGPASNRY